MNRKFLIGSLAVVAVTVPALAQMDAGRERPDDRNAPVTRADVEARLKDRFAKMDLDRDGAVTKEEAQQARDAKREERQDRRFAMLDTDKNGSISRAEFEARAKRPGRRHKMDRGGMKGGMFARADANNDGRVTMSEAMTPAMERFDRVDVNRDGTITSEERRAARLKFREEWRTKRSEG